VCHKCHKKGHPASRSPNYALIITSENIKEDKSTDEIVYLIAGDTTTKHE